MRFGTIEVKRRVWVGLGCAVAATAAWWGWTLAHRPVATAAAPVPQPFVRLGGGTTTGDRILRERADLLDPTPLFFPTEWNYGQQPLPSRLRNQPGQVFASFDPKFTVQDQNLKTFGREAVRAPERLADVLTQGNEAPFAGMGHAAERRASLSERAGFLEIRDFSGSNIIIEQPLTGFLVPRSDYAPLEFIVAVSSAGVVGDPVLASGSGWEDVDAFFRSYLVKTFRVGERLRPGSYRVLVGP
jgi:hypothetical protein